VPGVDDDGGEARDGRVVAALLLHLLEQRGDRIDRGIDVEHQAMAVFADRLQGEYLRPHLGLELEHHAHDAGPVAADPQLLHVRIVGGDLAFQLRERARELARLQVEHEALGILDREELVLDLRRRFERQAGVVLGGPDAARDYLRVRRNG
jgi:hypothetical protein